VVLPVPFGPMIILKSPALYAFDSMSKESFQSKYVSAMLHANRSGAY
jgi:hypothetical protein